MKDLFSRLLDIVCFSIIIAIACLGVLAEPVDSSDSVTVITRLPMVNKLNVPADSNIIVTFSADINPATVSASTFNVDGSVSGRIAGTYSTNFTVLTFNPTNNFKAGETITVTLTTGIQSTTGSALNTSVTWQFLVDVPGGYGIFPTGVNFNQTDDPTYSVACGDVDGDGDIDIVVGSWGKQNKVYKNDGTSSTWTPVNFGPTSSSTWSVALGDVDGDGDLDIVTTQNKVYKNDGTGTTWTEVTWGTVIGTTRSLALGDVDGDGDLDIVAGNWSQQNLVYKNDGTGTTWTGVNFGDGSDVVYSVALGDMDGDGDLDIIVGNYGARSKVYKNDGTGNNWTPINFSHVDDVQSVAIGDMDGDGDLDIVTGDHASNWVYLNDGTGTSWTSVYFGTDTNRTNSVSLGDVDGDGDLDIVTGNQNMQSVVYKNDGTGTIWTSINFGPGAGVGSVDTRSVALGDLDGDGDLEIVAGNTYGQNAIYANINRYTLVYLAGANGSISGNTTQTVAQGGNGTAVTALPATGYYFVNWSDASTANPRTDTGVTGNITVTANFAPIYFFTLVLQGSSRPDAGWIVPVTLKFFTAGADVLTATPLYTFSMNTTKIGSTAVAQVTGITPGNYDVTANSTTTLTNIKRAVNINATTTDVNLGTLLEGNANGKNLINILDFGILAASYGKTSGQTGFDSRADFDRNGVINIYDFGLLASNYGKHPLMEIP